MAEYKVIKVNQLIDEEKNIKKNVKNEIVKIHNETKEIIENLTENEAISLLKEKWITPLVGNEFDMKCLSELQSLINGN